MSPRNRRKRRRNLSGNILRTAGDLRKIYYCRLLRYRPCAKNRSICRYLKRICRSKISRPCANHRPCAKCCPVNFFSFFSGFWGGDIFTGNSHTWVQDGGENCVLALAQFLHSIQGAHIRRTYKAHIRCRYVYLWSIDISSCTSSCTRAAACRAQGKGFPRFPPPEIVFIF